MDNCASCATANRVRATDDTINSYDLVCFERVVNVCRATNVQREYDLFLGEPLLWDESPTDGRCLYELAGYLNLRIEELLNKYGVRDITRVYSEHFLKIQCSVTTLLQSSTCTDCSTNRDIVDDTDEENDYLL